MVLHDDCSSTSTQNVPPSDTPKPSTADAETWHHPVPLLRNCPRVRSDGKLARGEPLGQEADLAAQGGEHLVEGLGRVCVEEGHDAGARVEDLEDGAVAEGRVDDEAEHGGGDVGGGDPGDGAGGEGGLGGVGVEDARLRTSVCVYL